MPSILKSIKNKFQQLKNPTENTKEIIKLLLWILSVYILINLLPIINDLLLHLPSGLFFLLLINFFIIFWFSIKSYYDILAVKRALLEKNTNKLTIHLIYTLSQVLLIGFNIYICLTITH